MFLLTCKGNLWHNHSASGMSLQASRRGAINPNPSRFLIKVVMHKRRTSYNGTIATHLVGDIAGHQPVIIDDIIASGCVLKQLDILYDNSASGQACFAIIHPVMLPSAFEILAKDDRNGKLVVANSLPIPPEKQHPKLEVLSVAPLLAEIIQRVHTAVSTSGKLIKALPIY